VAGSALLFGLWHVLPALEMHDAHSLTSQLGSGWRAKVGTVLGTILATGSAGVLFAMLVVWSGSVLAPMGLHWAMNSTGSIAAWLVSRRAASTSTDSPSGDEPPAQEPEHASDAGP
jgi:membrane protease YdiL (CAAX protease family)